MLVLLRIRRLPQCAQCAHLALGSVVATDWPRRKSSLDRSLKSITKAATVSLQVFYLFFHFRLAAGEESKGVQVCQFSVMWELWSAFPGSKLFTAPPKRTECLL